MKKIYSIIIPTYNCWQLLEKTLKSIVSQDENLYECIIVDGKSVSEEKIKSVDEDSDVLSAIVPQESIYSLDFLKKERALHLYGNKARNGAIEIITKDYAKTHPQLNPTSPTSPGNKKKTVGTVKQEDQINYTATDSIVYD